MDIAILGDGGLGRAVALACRDRGDTSRILGRPPAGRHDPVTLAGADLIVDASRGEEVLGNIRSALEAGSRRIVIATTDWTADRRTVEVLLREHGAAAVSASNFSLGVALFGRLVDVAVELFGPLATFDPYLVEWHRRTKADRPSGTAADLARRILAGHPGKARLADATSGRRPEPDELEVASVRAGASPGMHLVGFDAPGETVELRLTARDRSAYAAGILAAADWLVRKPRPAGLHPFDPIVDELLAGVARADAARADAAHVDEHLATGAVAGPPARIRTHEEHKMTRFARTDASVPALRGAFTALVTPFTTDGRLDEPAFRQLVRQQVLAGIDGLVPCGTTGETPTLSTAERERMIALTVETAAERPSRSRVAIIAGTGTNDTAATVRATRRAAELGADAALVVAPYYNRPDQRMLESHFRAVADEGDLPVVVYNVPSRTGTNVEADTFLRLAQHPRIIAIKEASGNLEQIARICRDRPRDVAVLAGDDAWTLPVLALGGDGVISVASNEIPGQMASLCSAALAGDWDTARYHHEHWLPLFLANFRGGPNPVPVKAALVLMGLLESDAVRAPLLPLEDKARGELAEILRRLGLVEGGGGRMAAAVGAAVIAPGAAA